MASITEVLKLCRLCLMKDEVNTPIFEDVNDISQVFLKISTCLPLKVSRDDNLPKNICDNCSYKLELFYEFLHTCTASEKQLITWLNRLGVENLPVPKVINTLPSSHISNVGSVILKQEVPEFMDSHSVDDITPDDLHISSEAQDYVLQQQQQLPYEAVELEFQQENFMDTQPTTNVRQTATVSSKALKRKRPTAGLKVIPSSLDSEDDEDDIGLTGSKLTKTEEDNSDNDADDTAFVDLPSTSGENDQPGPSGVGKVAADASLSRPWKHEMKPVKLVKPNISRFKQKLYQLLYIEHKQRYNLEQCVIFLGDIKNFNEREYVPSRKMLYYINKLKKEDKKIKSKDKSDLKKCYVPVQSVKQKKSVAKRNNIIFDDSDEDNEKKQTELINGNSNTKSIPISATSNTVPVVVQSISMLQNKKHSDYNKSPLNPNSLHHLPNVERTAAIPKQSGIHKECLNVFGNEIERVQYHCPDCNEIFDNSIQLKRHIMIHKLKKDEVKKKKLLSCYICMAKFSERMQLWSHMRIHSNKAVSLKCSTCCAVFNNRSAFNNHTATCTAQDHLKCPNCNQKFNHSHEFRMHEKYCKGLEQSLMSNNNSSAAVNNTTLYQCSTCKKKFSDAVQLCEHKKTHTERDLISRKDSPELNVIENEKLLENYNNLPVSDSINRPLENLEKAFKYRCNICKRKFTDILQMRKHKKLHIAKETHISEIGGSKNTSRKTVLIDNIKMKNKSSKVYQSIVTKTNVSSDKKTDENVPNTITEVQKINENLDSDVEPKLKPKFKCCGIVFEERISLFLHMKSQIDKGCEDCNPVYTCRICETDFMVRFDWYAHCKIKHINLFKQSKNKTLIIRKPHFNCKMCYKKFDSSFKLKLHTCTVDYLHVADKQQMNIKKNNSSDLKIAFKDSLIVSSDRSLNNSLNDEPCLQTDELQIASTHSDSPTKQLHANFEVRDTGLTTYRCDMCYDVFYQESHLIEHEAFHKEIQMPEDNSNTLKQSSSTKNIQAGQKDMPLLHNKIDQRLTSGSVNHINIAVNLPNVVNTPKNKWAHPDYQSITAEPQQSLVTILIGNPNSSSASTCSIKPSAAVDTKVKTFHRQDSRLQGETTALTNATKNIQKKRRKSIKLAKDQFKKQQEVAFACKNVSCSLTSDTSKIVPNPSVPHNYVARPIQLIANASTAVSDNSNIYEQGLQIGNQPTLPIDRAFSSSPSKQFMLVYAGASMNNTRKDGNQQSLVGKPSENCGQLLPVIQKDLNNSTNIIQNKQISSSSNVVSTSQFNVINTKPTVVHSLNPCSNTTDERNLNTDELIILSDDSNEKPSSMHSEKLTTTITQINQTVVTPASINKNLSRPALGSRQLSKEVEEAEQAVCSIIEELKKNDVDRQILLESQMPTTTDCTEKSNNLNTITKENQTVADQRPRIFLRNISELMENKSVI